MDWSIEKCQGQIKGIWGRIGPKMLKAAHSQTQRRQSSWEHLDVLWGEPDQSFRNKDSLRRWSDLSCIPLLSFILLLAVCIYLAELRGTALFPSFPCLHCRFDCLNINEAVSPMYNKHKRTVIKDDISKPHSLPSPLVSFSQEIAAYLITFEKHEEWLTTSPKTR